MSDFVYRNKGCGELTLDDVGERVILSGWAQRRRDHGGLIFIDLRDRSGLVQVVFNPEFDEATHRLAHEIRIEATVRVEGKVVERPEGTVNPNMATGKIEVEADSLRILGQSKPLPFLVDERADVDEMVRLKFRYLDLRREEMRDALFLRHNVVRDIRNYLSDGGFIEVETPVLTKSTPEGARDFLVPSRLKPEHFYALPQSPQLFKQLLMVSGFEKYFQIAHCFRDEDLRADRQPEHTQVDMELSFVTQEDIFALIEGMIGFIFRRNLGVEIEAPFVRMSWDEAMLKYGTDKPDIRFGMEIDELSGIFRSSEFKVFSDVLSKGGCIRGLNAKGAEAKFSRSEVDGLVEFARGAGAKGLVWIVVGEDLELKSPVVKFLSDEEIGGLKERLKAEGGDLLLIVADEQEIAANVLGELRLNLADKLGLIEESAWKFLWVTHFPMFEYNDKEKRLETRHHPFTRPSDESLDILESEPLKAKSVAYDIVLNGVEIGGGSLRIFERELQERIFKILGLTVEDFRRNFGFLIEAFEFGPPPHGGIALGLDRLVMLMAGKKSIRDVMAFPKTQSGGCPLTGAPAVVTNEQLRELKIRHT